MLVPIFNNYHQVIMYIGTSEDDNPADDWRLLDGAVFIKANTMRTFTFSAGLRTWTERVHPDTQAALDRVEVLEAQNVALDARLKVLEPPVGGPP